MNNIPTPHINANFGDIAKTVLMPGDPLRARFIAENFLTDAKCINSVRNMLGFTGFYQDKKVSVMGSGMGIPSIAIYSYELYNFYNVDTIIRIGSAGAINSGIDIGDIVIAMGASTNSNYASQYRLNGNFSATCTHNLLKKAVFSAEKLKLNFKVGNVLSSDTFYSDDTDELKNWGKMGILAVEMESVALYMNAARSNKNAICILTISDCPFKGTSISSTERQIGFSNMIKLALDMIQ